MHAGVPQGSDLSPDLCNVFTADITQSINILLNTYANDTVIVILFSCSNSNQASKALQDHANKINTCAKKWKIKINTDKSVSISFTLNISPRECTQLMIDYTQSLSDPK